MMQTQSKQYFFSCRWCDFESLFLIYLLIYFAGCLSLSPNQLQYEGGSKLPWTKRVTLKNFPESSPNISLYATSKPFHQLEACMAFAARILTRPRHSANIPPAGCHVPPCPDRADAHTFLWPKLPSASCCSEIVPCSVELLLWLFFSSGVPEAEQGESSPADDPPGGALLVAVLLITICSISIILWVFDAGELGLCVYCCWPLLLISWEKEQSFVSMTLWAQALRSCYLQELHQEAIHLFLMFLSTFSMIDLFVWFIISLGTVL